VGDCHQPSPAELLRLWERLRAALPVDAIASELSIPVAELSRLIDALDRLVRREWGPGTRCVLFLDGASRGNPGPSGIGVVLRDEDSGREYELSEYIGNVTNNVAEYTALVAGLKKAKELGYAVVEVRSDSELLVKQLKGQYRVKAAALVPLWREARDLFASFRHVAVVHIPREANRRADQLSNLAIDAAIRGESAEGG
jgi:ribonuclease HI